MIRVECTDHEQGSREGRLVPHLEWETMGTEKRQRQKQRRQVKRAEVARRRRIDRRRVLLRTWLAVTGLILAVGIVFRLLGSS